VTGIIAAIHVRENQQVKRGDLLLELANESQKRQVAYERAQLKIARSDLERLRNGERPEKRKVVAAAESARRVSLQQAEAVQKRILDQGSSASAEEREKGRFNVHHAQVELAQATAERTLVEAPARAEDIAAAEGRVAAAEARLGLAEADLAKTRLQAPFAGLILQIHAEPGELATPTNTQSLLTMADLSHRRVRAFIEELDAGRARVGQHAVVTADGYPNQEFSGKVAVVIPRMGNRAPQTDQPNEYKDMYFREVLIDLESTADLPVKLRVKVRIDHSTNENKWH
jgi:HlyD family secretion protein